MTKVSIIGSGNVGSTLAMRIAEANLADVALYDIAADTCKGKTLDLTDAAPIAGHNRAVTALADYSGIKNSSIVVITAGFPRMPGMSREELLAKNASIVKDAVGGIKRHSPSAIVILVTNPLDAMTYLAYKAGGFSRNKVFGMAGDLDTARFVVLLAEAAGVPYADIETYVLGSHGDTMVPVLSHTKIKGKSVYDVLSEGQIEDIVARTKKRGAEIINLLKAGSAYYAPSAAVFGMVKAVINDTNGISCVSCVLDGEYGLKDICIGVPASLGKDGIGSIKQLSLNEREISELKRSAEAIRKTLGTV